MNLFFSSACQSWLSCSSTVMRQCGAGPCRGQLSFTPGCQSPLSCATMWSWQVSVEQLSWNYFKCEGPLQQDNWIVFCILLLFLFLFLLISAVGCECLSAEQKEVLLWLFRPPLQTQPLSEKPNLTESSGEKLVEIGPRYVCGVNDLLRPNILSWSSAFCCIALFSSGYRIHPGTLIRSSFILA